MRFTEIDIEKNIKIGDYYNKKITLSFNDTGKPLRFQIPRMYMPFGLSGFTPEVGPTKWNVDFALSGWDQENNYINKFYTFLKKLETHILENIKEHSVEIFGSSLSCETLENIFNSNIKENGRDPKFRVKVDTDTQGTMKPRVFDINENDITDEARRGLYKGYTGVAMIELSGVYFLNKMFGLTWKMNQMKVFEPQRLHGFQFNLAEEEDQGESLTGFQFQI
jgi:hypothetical protein